MCALKLALVYVYLTIHATAAGHYLTLDKRATKLTFSSSPPPHYSLREDEPETRQNYAYPPPNLSAKGNATNFTQIDSTRKIPYGFHHMDNFINRKSKRDDGFMIFFDINLNAAQAQKYLDYMKEGFFLDDKTNTVKVHSLVFNEDIETFMLVKNTLTWRKEGNIRMQTTATAFKLDDYQTDFEYVRFILEGVLIVILALQMVSELVDMLRSGKEYFTEVGNYLDWIHFGVMTYVFYKWIDLHLHLYRDFHPRMRYYVYDNLHANLNILRLNHTADWGLADIAVAVANDLGADQGHYANAFMMEHMFDVAVQIQDELIMYRGWQMISLTLFVGRALKYMHFQPRLALVTKTLMSAAQDLFHFSIVFMMVTMVYTYMGYCTFGSTIESFNDPSKAFLTTFMMAMGEFGVLDDVMLLEPTQRVFGMVYFFGFMVLAFLLLLNILLAIIVDAYVEALKGQSNTNTIMHDLHQITTEAWDTNKSWLRAKKRKEEFMSNKKIEQLLFALLNKESQEEILGQTLPDTDAEKSAAEVKRQKKRIAFMKGKPRKREMRRVVEVSGPVLKREKNPLGQVNFVPLDDEAALEEEKLEISRSQLVKILRSRQRKNNPTDPAPPRNPDAADAVDIDALAENIIDRFGSRVERRSVGSGSRQKAPPAAEKSGGSVQMTGGSGGSGGSGGRGGSARRGGSGGSARRGGGSMLVASSTAGGGNSNRGGRR